MSKMNKKSILLVLVLTFVFGTIGVSAAGHSYKFVFMDKSTVKSTSPYAKNDSEQNAYVTVYKNSSTITDFIEGKDVFGCRVRKNSDGSAVTDYTYVKRVNYTYKLPYTTKGYSGTKYYLNGKIDSSSALSLLQVEGLWLP